MDDKELKRSYKGILLKARGGETEEQGRGGGLHPMSSSHSRVRATEEVTFKKRKDEENTHRVVERATLMTCNQLSE